MPKIFPGFTLQFDLNETKTWASLYDMKDDNEAMSAGKRIAAGERTYNNLLTIAKWKSPRRVELLRDNSDQEIDEALELALEAKQPRSALAILIGLRGVGLPMASAIMTVFARRPIPLSIGELFTH